ncbi:LytTR family DNA-binding domain-containing protein [Aliiglaciecola sp. CAU 1673]|uniref:LytR/AlgR family response regulator transcription factor n=1 Tax=Aliiglaciecola sp. CAU 1673 TaxID=3032595 RepID=UPI0023DA5E8D|nr:LytTR family DNA-binding domain-containing protein [Aliiglaciecola sp. CAU 1673]MDF2180360.1 LytTR family DNA-binding domain-containing protein [Aliiglaciecola sp. CAU 1673]
MSIRCWIIDDEPAAHKGIEIALKKHDDFEIVFHGYAVADALPANAPGQAAPRPDVIFLDIEMPGQSGFSLFEQWQGELPLIVFITAYNQHAIEAFNKAALDYLLKPIEQGRFDEMTQRVRNRLQEKSLVSKKETLQALIQQVSAQQSPLGLSVKTDEGLFRLKQKDIILIESVGDHLAIYYGDKTLITRDSFKRLATELDADFFFRTHKSFMVNIAHVLKWEKGRFGDGQLLMSNQKSVKLSRRYKEAMDALNKR